MLGETSLFTLPGKVPLWQKFQNDVLCGSVNMDVSPYILKSKFFFKNTCSTMTPWIHVGLLYSKSEMIYLPKKVCLIIIHRNTTHILDMSYYHKHQQQRYHYENTKMCMFIHYMCVDIPFPLTKSIPFMFEPITTHYQTLQTWISYNATRYHKFNTLPHALPHMLPYIFS